MNKLSLLLILSLLESPVIAHRLLPNMAQFLPENPVILEAGSYDGEDAERMSQIWPKATIYTFEPVPLLYLKTKARTFNCKNVNCYQIALSHESGRAKFYVSSGMDNEVCGSSSLLEPKDHLTIYPTVRFNNCIDVQTMNLDEWARANKVDHIDFMWLDMQGAELRMLRAAPEILKTVKLIFIEVAFAQTYKDIPLYKEVREFLESQGFSLIFEETCGAAKAEGNALFIRKIS